MDEAVVAEYLLMRKVGREVCGKLTSSLLGDDVMVAARRLGMVEGEKTVVFNSESDMAALSDYAIHEIRHDGLNAFDRMLADDPPAEGSPEMRFLRSSREAHFSVFKVLERLPGVGARVIDLFRKTELTIVDMGFSQTAHPGWLLSGRVHSPAPGWWMTTGGGLPVTDEAMAEIEIAIRAYHKQHGADPKDGDFSLLITRACLKAGAGNQMRYIDANASGKGLANSPTRALAPIRSGPKVGRNDPCPCASGKKFKKCCGR